MSHFRGNPSLLREKPQVQGALKPNKHVTSMPCSGNGDSVFDRSGNTGTFLHFGHQQRLQHEQFYSHLQAKGADPRSLAFVLCRRSMW